MPRCIVENCGNRTSCKSARQEVLEEEMKITFHKVPKDTNSRILWLKNLGLEQYYMRSDAVVCSLHFKNEDFDRTSLSRVRLKSHAVPYVQIPKEDEGSNNERNTELYSELLNENSSSTLHVVLKEEVQDDSDVFAEPLQKIQRCDSVTNIECLKTLLNTNDIGVQVKMPSQNKATCVSPERIFHSPEKEELRKHATRLKKSYQSQLKTLQQKCKRRENRIENLETILLALRKKDLLEGELIDTL